MTRPVNPVVEGNAEINAITELIIGCAYRVANPLGHGFLETVYENELAIELRKTEFSVRQQGGVAVYFDDVVVGEYAADLLVEDLVFIELKVAKAIDNVHVAQYMNYLKASGKTICLLLNFGLPRIEVKRILNTHLPAPESSPESP